MRIKAAFGTLLAAAAICGLMMIGGCNGALTSDNSAMQPVPSVQKPGDWGVSLLAGGTNGAEMYPAKFTFDVTAPPSCANDFVVYNTSLTGAAGAADIIAFNNLYATQGSVGGLCSQNGPSVMWAYNTGTAGPVATSPVLSGDGTKVAFVENPTGGAAAILHILKWKSGQGTAANSPTTPDTTLTAGQNWASNCPAANSCVANLTFSGGVTAKDSNSSPFYDYVNDVIYLGDNVGNLHKFTGVFKGTPAEVGAPWPLPVDTGIVLSSPVHDSVSGNIFIGDASGRLQYVRETNSNKGTCNAGSNGGVVPCLGNDTIGVPASTNHTGMGVGPCGGCGAIVGGPIVDGTNGTVFVFDGTDTTNNGTVLETDTGLSAILQAIAIGGSAPGSYIHTGAFDNAYLTSAQGATTGHLYVCGKDPANGAPGNDRPTIFQLSFLASGTLSGVRGFGLTGLVSNNGEACSPVTEINNTNAGKEWIFFSIGNLAANADPIPSTSNCRTGNDATNGGKGCIMSIDITTLGTTGWPPVDVTNAVPVPAGAATGPNGGNIDSTSGIIVDNIGSSSQTSNIYFSLTGNSSGAGPGLPSCNTTGGVGCAVKLTQSALN